MSYTRADQEIVRRIVALLEAQGWSVWWDTRIAGGERWDATIEREINAAHCVVVVWTPQSIDREWVREEADHGRDRGILVPVLIGLDKPPFGFGRIQARSMSGWDGVSRTVAADQLLADVRQKLGGVASLSSAQPQPSPTRYRQEGRIKIDAKIIHGTLDGWFLPGAGKTEWFKDLDIGPEMVVVPAGSFIMGSNDRSDEKPPHKVTIDEPFAVGRFAVTFAEWDAARLPRKPKPFDLDWGRGRRPVIDVNWEDAKAYAAWLSQNTGKGYRLLSEAEWEYCCRAGTTTKYAFGDSITRQQAQYSERQPGSAKQTVEVGRFPPNHWGLYDTHGNLWEFCDDYWHETYEGAPQDGSVWQGGDPFDRVRRGGSWCDLPDNLRSACRNRYPRADTDGLSGFRVSRALSPLATPA